MDKKKGCKWPTFIRMAQSKPSKTALESKRIHSHVNICPLRLHDCMFNFLRLLIIDVAEIAEPTN